MRMPAPGRKSTMTPRRISSSATAAPFGTSRMTDPPRSRSLGRRVEPVARRLGRVDDPAGEPQRPIADGRHADRGDDLVARPRRIERGHVRGAALETLGRAGVAGSAGRRIRTAPRGRPSRSARARASPPGPGARRDIPPRVRRTATSPNPRRRSRPARTRDPSARCRRPGRRRR